ncbi:MAG: sensor histidine kinase [Acidimicrobiia bacterium]
MSWPPPDVTTTPPAFATSRTSASPASPPAVSRVRRRGLYGPLLDPLTWKETLHLLLDLPAGIAFFTVAVTLVSVAFAISFLVIGAPAIALTVLSGRLIGAVERERAKLLLDTALPAFAPFDMDGTWWQRFKRAIADGAGWRGLGYAFIFFPLAIFNFIVTIVVWSLALSLSLSSTFGWIGDIQFGDNYIVTGWGRAGVVAGATVLGLVLLALAPRVTRGLAALDRRMIEAFLSPGHEAQLKERVQQLQVSRDASVDSAGAELRRIERDLHDGAQQRLVSLAMNLGLAKERLAHGADPLRAVELVDRAHDEAKQAIAELRDLVRGIHPAVLTDRGLDAALSALAARSPVPIVLNVTLPARPPAATEATAYFVVAEALTNIAKHSQATHGWVSIGQQGNWLTIDIRDDGVGGANERAGGGLAGLRDRVLATEGDLRIASPDGGPTMILVRLPCAS